MNRIAPNRGFILLIVIGLLATLAMMGIMLVSSSRLEVVLAQDRIDTTRVRLIARSGLEHAMLLVRDPRDAFWSDSASFGDGIYEPGGDGYFFQFADRTGTIDINDGIAAGRMDLGRAYDAGAVDPWPWDKPDDSGLINLRTRRLLNAYGDCQKFLVENGKPDAHETGDPFEFTSTDAGRRGHSMPGIGPKGGFLHEKEQIARHSTGLGDRIVASRPQSGYAHVDGVREIVNRWAIDVLGWPVSRHYPDPFFEYVSRDFTTRAFIDRSIPRLIREPGTLTEGAITSDRVNLKPLDLDPPDLTDLWRPHAASPININTAPLTVKAAVFYSLCNVSLIAEGGFPVPLGDRLEDGMFAARLSSLGVHGLIYDEKRLKEYGFPKDPVKFPSPANVQRNRMFSLRDSLILAHTYNDYAWGNWPRTFGDFNRFCDHFAAYDTGIKSVERMEHRAKGRPGRHFSVYETAACLPHVLGPIRRLPGFMGAPRALMSPVFDPEPRDVLEHPGDHTGEHALLSAEDMVFRHMNPKICFLSHGIYHFQVHGWMTTPREKLSSKLSCHVQFWKPTYIRGQQDFMSITEHLDPDLEIGPWKDPLDPDPAFGHVGLKPAPMTVPVGSMAFGHVEVDSELPPESDPTLVGLPGRPFADRFQNCQIETRVDVPDGREDGGDLSPFGGVSFTSFGHGPRATGVFNDSVYWRPQVEVLNPTVPTGTVGSRGGIAARFRMPGGLSRPTLLEESFGIEGGQPSGFFHTITSIRLWERRRNEGGHPVLVPVGIHLGILRGRRNPLLIAQVEVGDADDWNHEGEFARLAYNGPPPAIAVRDEEAVTQTDCLSPVLTPSYVDWIEPRKHIRWLDVELSGERWEPGTWHTVNMNWHWFWSDGSEDAPIPMQAEDIIRIQTDNTLHEWPGSQSGTPPFGPGRPSLETFDSNMVVSIGEQQVRWPGWQLVQPSLTGPPFSRHGYLPLARFDSTIDAVAVNLGDGAVELGESGEHLPGRYGITPGSTPSWIVKLPIREGSRLLYLGARIFRDRYCDIGVEIQPLDSGPHPVSGTTFDIDGLFFDRSPVSRNFSVRYSFIPPIGEEAGPVNSSPWIQELCAIHIPPEWVHAPNIVDFRYD